jgi:hypothetical protein
MEGARLQLRQVALVAAIELWLVVCPAVAQTGGSRIDEALQNITALVRPGRIGYATSWDGNKYIQCRRLPEREPGAPIDRP